MAERKWTDEQKNAIYSRGGTLLLSAAAGSGKTAVLVERIITLLTDGNEPAEPSDLLVVTFTSAAAAEMRTRISDGIDALISREPSNSFYRSIKMKLAEADICTIDSFCMKLVRENFHNAGIEPDFTVLDNSDQKILIADAMSETLDNLCLESPDIYDMLNSVTSYGRDDGSLREKILRLYNFSLAHPFPERKLDEIVGMYEKNENIPETVWGKIIIENACVTSSFCRELIGEALLDIEGSEVIKEKYYSVISGAIETLDEIDKLIDEASWDSLFEFFGSLSIPKLPSAPRGFGKDPVKLSAEAKYKRVESLLYECGKNFCADTQDNINDTELLYPVIKSLVKTVKEFGTNYMRLKREKNSYTFSDIMHFALRLLIDENDGEIKKTSLASSLENRFREILIDEYQDTNEAQDMLFMMISKNRENLFMVGDVKQSIYRFRLAMPEIFVKKSREYAPFDGKTYPAEIVLGKNFRSRKGILDNINFLFGNLMSEYAGEMEYTEKEALYYADGYPEDKEPAVEMRFLQAENVKDEAAYIASIIENMLSAGMEVQDKNGKRKAKAGDFCILLRSAAGKTDIYAKALEERGLKACGEKKTNLFSAPEVNVFMSLLKVINNPTDDISILSVMLSPIFAFTADEITEIKLADKKQRMAVCLKKSAVTNEKAALFLEKTQEYRRLSAVMPFDIFIRTLLDMTGYMSLVGAFPGGENRRLNLIMLCELAAKYATSGNGGIGGFIRYIEKASENGADIPAFSSASQSDDTVKIYSIHKSKGLEFPFVIIADCAKKFNVSDISEDMIISPSAGVGMVILNNERLQKYSSIGHRAAKIAVKKAMISEELRVLYVAMTRARERLILVSTVKNLEKAVCGASSDAARGRKPSPCAILNATSYMRWLLLGYMSHPDMNAVASIGGMTGRRCKKADSRLNVIVDEFSQDGEILSAREAPEPDADIVEKIAEAAEYEYPYIFPADARPKRTASDFEKEKFNPDYFASSKPSFIYGEKLTPAQIGTANHLMLQNIDFNADSAASERERLLKANILTEAQAKVIKLDKIDLFLKSDLCRRIINADSVYREKEFTVEISLGDIDKTANENVKNEKILVLGKADLIFTENGNAVVVDYKTDRNKTDSDFTEIYGGQLDMYKRAAEQILELPVTETLIYSLETARTVRFFGN